MPKRVFSHGFLLHSGEKMSKSVGNVVDPFSLAQKYGVDQLRYFMLREVPFGQDGNYSHDAIVNRINADLANDLGNLTQRSLSMVSKNCEGKVPDHGEFSQIDEDILGDAYQLLEATRVQISTQKIHRAIDAIWRLVGESNKYFASQQPWALKKTDPQRMQTVLYVTAEVIRIIAIMAQPIMPESSGKILDLLAIGDNRRDFSSANANNRLKPGEKLPEPAGVFPRFVKDSDDS